MIIKKSATVVAAGSAAYESGDLVGAKLTLSDVWTIPSEQPPILCFISVGDLTKQSLALDVVLFDADPTGTTFTDNAALDVADADLAKILAVVSIAATDYHAFADNSVATVKGLALPLDPASGKNLYACLVTRGAPTYVENELSITFGFIK